MAVKSELIPFSEKYFGFQNNWHHKLFYLILENYIIQKDGVFCVNRENKVNKNILVLSPRFHAKSTVFSFVYPIWEIVKNPNIRILILSANEEIASSFVRQQMTALENNEKLLEDFGNLMPRTRRKWGERAFIVRRDTSEKDPTVSAAGFMGRIISKRADIIIMDDIIDLERSRTEKQREKVVDWFANVVYPILAPEGRIIIVGTRWHKEDFYSKVATERNFDINLSLRALVFTSGTTIQKRKNHEKIQFRKPSEMPYNPITDEPLSQDVSKIFNNYLMRALEIGRSVRHGVLWYPNWSYEKLVEKRKVMGTSAFYCQYLNEPVSDEETYFRKQSIDECYQRGKFYAMPDSWDNVNFPNNFPNKQLLVVMGVDLAIATKKSSDYSAIAVWGMSVEGTRYLLYIDKFKAEISEVRQKIIDVYHLYNPVVCVVESNAFQDLLRQELSEDINIIGEKTTSYTKFDETLGIAHMSSLFESGKVVIPNLGVKGYAAKSFYNDLISYTRDSHTPDTIIASWLALRKIQEFSESIKTQSGYFSQFSVNYQISNLISPHKIIIASDGKPYFSAASIVSVFLPREKSFLKNPSDILDEISKMPLFAVVKQGKTFLAYFINLKTKEIVVKMDGGGSLSFFCDTLLRWAGKLNNPQIVVYDSEPVGFYLESKNYPNMFCVFTNKEGKVAFKKTIVKNDIMLSVYLDRARFLIESEKIPIHDSATFREFNKILSVEGDIINTIDNESPDRAVVYSLAVALSESIKVEEKEKKTKPKKQKLIYPPYRVFNYQE